MKKTIVVFIIFLFLVSTVTPMVIGYNVVISERDEHLEKLTFVCSTDYDSSRLLYYREYLLRGYFNVDVVESEELILSGEQLSVAMVGGPMDSAWPMQSHDVHHTGRSPYSTADNPGIEKWRFYTSSWIEDSPAIDSDGIIYFGCFNYYLYALYPNNGTLKWKYKTGGNILGSSPAIAEDGTVYVGSWDDYLHAINPDGTMKWKFCVYDNIASSPAIAEDGTIYFGTLGSKTYAINPDGTEKWCYNTGWTESSPTIGDDGTVYIGSGDYYLYALNPNGTLKWRFKTGDEIHGDPSIAEDGTIYIGSYDDQLYALYPNGTKKWRISTQWGAANSASIDEDGTIYVGTDRLYAIYPNGTRKWNFDLGADRWVGKSSPAISADGTIYIGTHVAEMSGGDIIAVNPDGTEKWRKTIANKWVESSPSISEDGAVYIGSSYGPGRGYLHAFGLIETNEPPNAPSISGPTQGRAGVEYWYAFRAIDPDNNPVSYYVDWGDGTSSWVGTRASGEKCYFSHEWPEQGTYNISAKVKDVFDEESDWGYLDVTMPKNKLLYNPLLLRLLERFPNMFLILRYILELQ